MTRRLKIVALAAAFAGFGVMAGALTKQSATERQSRRGDLASPALSAVRLWT